MTTHSSFEKDISLLLREKYNNIKSGDFFLDVKRIESGEPLDYVIGFSSFLNCHIDLSYEPLIPRTETEYWVEQVIHEYADKQNIVCLDIFSGSGCIGIALLKHLTTSTVHFSEIDFDLIKQIQQNLKLNKINPDRYEIFQGDTFEKVPSKKYDLIVANPPYVSYERKGNVTPSVHTWEPQKAVFAPDDGLQYIKILLQEGLDRLTPNGVLYIEFDEPQHTSIEHLIALDGRYEAHFFKDQYDRWRYVKLLATPH